MLKNVELSNQLGVKVNDLKFCVCLHLTLESALPLESLLVQRQMPGMSSWLGVAIIFLFCSSSREVCVCGIFSLTFPSHGSTMTFLWLNVALLLASIFPLLILPPFTMWEVFLRMCSACRTRMKEELQFWHQFLNKWVSPGFLRKRNSRWKFPAEELDLDWCLACINSFGFSEVTPDFKPGLNILK